MDNYDFKDFTRWLWEIHRIDPVWVCGDELDGYVEEYLKEGE